MRWKLIGSLTIAVAAGLGIYGWGNGFFLPCGPLLGLIGSPDCRIVASWPATQPQMLQVLPDGSLLTALRADGQEPTATQKLVQFDRDGKPMGEVALPSFAPELSWAKTALSDDGRLLAVTSVDKRATVLDRTTGAEVGGVDLFGVSYIGFAGEDRIKLNMGFNSFERPPENVARLYSFDGTALGEATGAEAAPIFTTGTARASTADGRLIAQHVETLKDTGIVAVRLAESQYSDWAGQLLVASLGSWRLGGQQLPELSFSPDGRYLAASFDAPDEWGKENSALIVWRIEDRQIVARVPTWRAEWENITWLADQPAIAATRFHLDSRVGDVAVIRYRP